MGNCHSHDSDGNSCALHVDGSTQRNRYRIKVLVQPQLLAELHIDRDICRRASGKEGSHAALLQAAQHQRIRIALQEHKADNRVDDKSQGKHAAYQYQQQHAIINENSQAVLRNCGEYQAHNTKRSHLDNPEHCLGHNSGKISHYIAGFLGSQLLKAHTENNRPAENTQVIAGHDSRNRIHNHIGKNSSHNLTDTIRCRVIYCIRQLHGHWKQCTGSHSRSSSQQGAQYIQENYILKASANITGSICQRTDNQHKHQHRCNALQQAYKQCTKNRHHGVLRHSQRKSRTDHHADYDAQNQADALPFCKSCTHHNKRTPP